MRSVSRVVASCVPNRSTSFSKSFSTSRILLHNISGAGGATPAGPTSRIISRPRLPGIKHIVAVSSAKGGVGKSTTAVNLALGLSHHHDKRVGLLDADIYGPSIPTLMNLKGRKPDVREDIKKMIPLVNYGIKCMSMGFIVEEDTAMIWRGPMVMSALEQLLRHVDWGDLDVLVIDLPPGTGDAQLTICQKVPLSGAVIVSTPQDVALADVVRGVNMFQKVDVPIIGVVENMSFFECSNCHHTTHIFGSGGAQATASRMGLPFLGAIPIHIEIRETSDSGKPITVGSPESSQARPYFEIAKKVITRLEELDNSATQQGPKITIEKNTR
eukprot:TRINITY_DN9708_c0_g1_i3.p1 TRINITY_DN9708_c0_g1~~TRINITY_DN9708_c0_g1_i3.p1  ORF type:complete len:328 (+),score=71.43 TRINITY_DN9708_c0_g1_i3:1-984(+)